MKIIIVHFDSNKSNISPESLKEPAIILFFVRGGLYKEQIILLLVFSKLLLNNGSYPLTIFVNV